ncbi:ABC transporter ATP-binding protein [Sandaracinus amylolyticus]|uniref:Glycerol-3-phosphate ABC transporter, ATP-binding protein UgpC n=1 Tax=Sandaracinus amylolyticus TaxID=927083 RepID=A0A0F6YPF3_9BACT|nr:ABC transporter ATP-binding protein [Sandaracinus amylolyticus]AKF11426.1 Glycerol-3-phosphate ABC transporter, ATP-binding protein UgpC [Sandaracinus amylolyticus]
MASLELDAVSKIYPGGTPGIRRLDLAVRDGELLVLVGPSGCGKSTALRIVAGLEDVSSGRVRIGKRDVTALPPQDRNVAMVFQSYALYPHKTVRANLAFPLETRRVPRDDVDRRVREVASILDLEPLLERKPAQLSGGQRQRVALGRAMVRAPDVFLLDEPLSNLDASLRVRMRAELHRLHRRLGATMLYVTHDQEEAMTLGSRVAVLRDGELEQIGEPMELHRRPATVFVARFLGSPSMNVIEGEVHEGRARTALGAIDAPLASGTRVLVGVRPRDVVLGGEGDVMLPIDVVEPLGDEAIVHLAADTALVAIAPIEPRLAPGDRVGVRLRRDRIHLFDAATGRRV